MSSQSLPKSLNRLNCNIHVLRDLVVVHPSVVFDFCTANEIIPEILRGYDLHNVSIADCME